MTEKHNNTFGFRFRDWKVYRDTRSFRQSITDLTKNFPKEERYALTDQTRRALNSVVLNIAEGSNRSTDKDTRLFINRALGSLDEVVACMDCAHDDALITEAQLEACLQSASKIAKQLKGFTRHLSKTVVGS